MTDKHTNGIDLPIERPDTNTESLGGAKIMNPINWVQKLPCAIDGCSKYSEAVYHGKSLCNEHLKQAKHN